jgi:hypothetical protein
MNRHLILCVLILSALAGCRKDNETRKPEPGYFRITEIRNPGLKSTGMVSDDSPKTTFQLGDLKASKEFYFLLSNGGDNSIFDVHLSTGHPQFAIAPESISLLPGKDQDGGDAFIPLISLGIIHGMQLNGVGFASLLPMDLNSATLTITGKTVENGDTIDLRSDFDFSVNAKRMDIRLFEGEQEVDITDPTGSASFPENYGGLGSIRYFHFTSGAMTVQNAGNVDIIVNVLELDESSAHIVKQTDLPLHPGESAGVTLTQVHVVVSLDSQGTITDDSRVQLGNDGKGYFGILFYSE